MSGGEKKTNQSQMNHDVLTAANKVWKQVKTTDESLSPEKSNI